MNKAIFWDKDGTLIPDIPYNVNPERISLYADVQANLNRLQTAGFRQFVVSNQAGVAYGLFDEAALTPVWKRLSTLLAPVGVHLDGVYYCPHHPGGKVDEYAKACACRKPEPGMLLKAAQDHAINLSESWMIGDILNDVEAGNRAGCRTVLVDRGNETEWLDGPHRTPTAVVNSIEKAADFILDYHD